MGPHQADIDAFSHPDPYIRAAAAERLGEARCIEGLDALVATMNWRQHDVEDEIEGRIAAVTALGKLGDRRAIPSLMAFLESAFDSAIPSEVDLACDAMVSLAKLHADEALPTQSDIRLRDVSPPIECKWFVSRIRSYEN